jgi:HEAT repeat protein
MRLPVTANFYRRRALQPRACAHDFAGRIAMVRQSSICNERAMPDTYTYGTHAHEMRSPDGRSIDELFSAATDWSRDDGFGDWTAVEALQRIGSADVCDRALALTRSYDPRVRARGVDILAQLGVPDRTFPEECVAAAVRLANHDSDPHVVCAAALALGHLRQTKAMPTLVQLAAHPDPDVRYAVAQSLGGASDPTALAALIHLTRDKVADVRDWATFGLGHIGKVDTPEVRQALVERLVDVDRSTRTEAICGLACWHDPRAIAPLIDALAAYPADSALIAAAMNFLDLADEDELPTSAQLVAALREVDA